MSIRSLQEFTRYARYSKHIKAENRRETWAEQVDRMFNMHKTKFTKDGVFSLIEDDWNFARQAMLDKKILGSQRALQFGGPAILKKNARQYNCSMLYMSYPKALQQAFYLLLCGCGVGASVQQHHVEQLPDIISPTGPEKTYVIPDTIEGWADSLGVLLSSYYNHPRIPFPEFRNTKVVFDYSLIRPKGSKLSFGGKAPGPEGLQFSHIKIQTLIERCLTDRQTKFRDIDVYDIFCHMSDAVLSGGIRRSAGLMLFTHTSKEMYKAKIGNWFVENPQRARTNNSALLIKGQVSREDFHSLIKNVQDFGEPGFVWAENTEALGNPCQEVMSRPYWDDDGSDEWKEEAAKAYKIITLDNINCIPGVEFCNLSEINMKKCKTPEDFYAACRATSILGTFQASYTKFNYLGKTSERITEREALLGVSMTGMMDSPDISFDPQIQRNGAKIVKSINEDIAAKLNINIGARCTVVKPSGTASCLLGTSSGIHPHHSKRYIRHVQCNETEFSAQYFKKINPHAVEKSVWSSTGTDYIMSFLCEVPDGSKTKNQISAIEFLECVKNTQINWISYGKRKESCTRPWLSHSVSNTVVVKPNEWDEVEKYIFDNQKYFAGISLLPFSGDMDYPQAPFVNIETPAEILRTYGDATLFASGLITDAERLWNDNLWEACSTALGQGEDLSEKSTEGLQLDMRKIITKKAKEAWIERIHNFGLKYCPLVDNVGNGLGRFRQIKHVTYLLKKVHMWKVWCDLQRNYVEIDWSDVIEIEDDSHTTDRGGACDGPACELKPFIDATKQGKG